MFKYNNKIYLKEDLFRLKRSTTTLSKYELDDIKNTANKIWKSKDDIKALTTYEYSYSNPNLNERQYTRPTSPTRRNNPHPPL